MPFGVKNARAKYRRAMQTIFADILHKIVEFYVADLVVKPEKKVWPFAWSLANLREIMKVSTLNEST